MPGDLRFHALDGGLLWHGATEIVRDERGQAQFWRLPRAAVSLVGSETLTARAQVPAGVSAIVRTDARTLTIDVTSHDDMRAPVDVLVDGRDRIRLPLAPGRQQLTAPLAGRPAIVEVVLPQRGRITVGELVFEHATAVESIPDDRPVWIAYGSSITQGAFADGPLDTWVRAVGATLGLRPMNLGLGGECHLDPVAARHVRDASARLITMCVGINIQMQASYSRRTLRSAIVGFIETVREGHPSTPLVLIGPICSPERESVPNAVGLSLSDVRGIVHETASALDVPYIDGLEVFGEADASLLVDGLHPGSAGHALMAQRLSALLAVHHRLPDVT